MQDNKLIAEFMGHTFADYDLGGLHYLIDGNYVEYNSLQYDASWDWLMPVVQKCFDTQQPEEGQHYFINESLLTMDIEVVYDRVVGFIKEYNDGCHQTYNDE